MTAPPNPPQSGLTAADLSFEPEDGFRRELHDGVVYVVPPPSDDHQWDAKVLDSAFSAEASDDVYVLQGCGVHLGEGRVYVPDVLVVRRDAKFHDNAYDPDGVVLVAEVVSRSSTTHDRITKLAVYAEYRIPHYWWVDRGPTIACHRLTAASKTYRVVAKGGPGDVVEVSEPWPVRIAVDELVMPHKR